MITVADRIYVTNEYAKPSNKGFCERHEVVQDLSRPDLAEASRGGPFKMH